MKALELFNQGDLDGSVEKALEFVRGAPGESGARQILAELLCVRGELERADKQLETIILQQPRSALPASLLRQLIRAETSRREFWTKGRLPEFVGEPDEELQNRLLAAVSAREGKHPEALEILASIEESEKPVSGKMDDKPFESFRDLDDLCAGVWEVLTSTGKYFWIPASRVISMEFEAPARPRDMLWRQCQMTVQDGPDGVVYIPSIYASTNASDGPEFLLGKNTDWRAGEDQPVLGFGQRLFAIDDADVPIMNLKRLEFTV